MVQCSFRVLITPLSSALYFRGLKVQIWQSNGKLLHHLLKLEHKSHFWNQTCLQMFSKKTAWQVRHLDIRLRCCVPGQTGISWGVFCVAPMWRYSVHVERAWPGACCRDYISHLLWKLLCILHKGQQNAAKEKAICEGRLDGWTDTAGQ